MPIEQVKLHIKKLKCPIPENLKRERGKIGLYRGKFARVEIWTSKKKPLCLCRNVNGKTVHTFYGLDEITLANDTARRYEIQGKENGQSFGTISDDEKTALIKWRDYVFSEIKAGKPAPSLSEVIGAMIEHEQTKEATAYFEEATFQFIEAKDTAGGISLAYRAKLKNRLLTLAKHFKRVRLQDITEATFKEALLKILRKRSAQPAPKTIKHWIDTAKELFKWYYTRENAKRRTADKLTNPLENISAPRIPKTKDPEILTRDETSALLNDLLQNAPIAVPAVAVQMFCGVRNAEALRLRWKDLKDGEIHLSCTITKTKVSRSVPIPENLKQWLNAAALVSNTPPDPKKLIFPFNDTPPEKAKDLSPAVLAERIDADFHARSMTYCRALNASEKRTGIKKPKNAFRHTAVSCLAVLHGQATAADYCGHSIRTQGVNYRGLVSKQEAQDYFGIMPPQSGKPAIVFDRSRKRVLLADTNEDSRPASANT